MLDESQEKQPFQYVSRVVLSDGMWRALHGSVCASFSVKKYGPSARTLAEDAYQRMLSGAPPYPDGIDDVVGRYTFPLALAASQLGMNLRLLRQWMETGVIQGKKIRPPAKSAGRDFVAGYELIAAQRRLQDVGLLNQ